MKNGKQSRKSISDSIQALSPGSWVTQKSIDWPKLSAQSSILDLRKIEKTVQNRTFEDKLAFGPSKYGLWNGVLKKHEQMMRKNHPKTMPKVIRKSINFKAFLKKLNVSKCFVLLYFFMFFSNESASEIDAKMMKNRCQNEALKISENRCKNGSQNHSSTLRGYRRPLLGYSE